MDNLLAKLMNNILNINVFVIRDGSADLKPFIAEHNKNHFSIQLDDTYLSSFLGEMDDHTFYEIVDNLNERIFAFKYQEETFILGPYLKRFINEMEAIKIGTDNSISPAKMEALKLQYFALPIFDSYHIENTVNRIIQSLDDGYRPYLYVKHNHYKDNRDNNQRYVDVEDDTSENDIYAKYEIENDLLYQVEHGQVEEIKLSMQNISNVAREDYLISFHASNPQAAMASYRTLLRKSAEKSGLPVTIIDRIISKYTQLMLSSSPSEQFSYLSGLSIELTSEVRNYLLKVKCESPLIKRVCEYLFVHYSQNIALESLSERFKISPYYMAHLFKKETGKTIREFLESIRLMRAEEMLKDNYLSISEIANLVGYSDNNYFSKVFKKQYRMTPSEYRLSSHK